MPTAINHQAAEVHYTVEVLDASGRVERRLPRKRNLILDQGLDSIANQSWTRSFAVAVVGTGTTPTKRDSGAITFSRAGNTVTASAGFFEAGDVGRLLKFDTGEEVRITAFTDATTVTTATAGTIAAAEGTVWYVNQKGLTAESKRSNVYSSDAGANGSSFLAGTWTHKRTFLFSAEVGTVVYREIGWAATTSPGANLFGRDLLPGVGVSLVAGRQLRVTVELAVSYAPTSAQAYASVVAGWSQGGTYGIESISSETASMVNAAGDAIGGSALEPSGAGYCALSTSATAIRNASSGNQLVGGAEIARKVLTAGSYASGSFTRTKSVAFTVAEANSANIRSLAIVSHGYSDTSAVRVLLAAAETKTSDQTLSLTWQLSWGRVLNNA